jgi:class 3 adenylate cyclase/tetratricopeptide (TPR) repeat protein
MLCSNCGTENPDAKKFCAQCGAALPLICTKCGSENLRASKFCGECGAPLSQGSPTPSKSQNVARATPQTTAVQIEDSALEQDGERKTVTALFADIKGSMELMEDLDPEEARAIVDPALRLMIDAAHRYEGYIVQSTGDGILALFGAPIAHEDHAQRALYAALRMQEDLKRYSDQLRADGRLPLQARVGVNTGEAVVRSIRTDDAHTEYTPIGHSVNLAARMQTLAPIGSIAATDNTRALCEGYFVFRALGPTRVKGVSEPINIYEITGLGPLRTRLQRSAGRGLSKFVGRQAELDALSRALASAKQGHGQIAAAVAEAGVGKSRLFYEFRSRFLSDCLVLDAFSVSHGKASAYLPVIDLLNSYFRISVEDDAGLRHEKITGKVLALDRALEDTLPYLFALLGASQIDSAFDGMDLSVRRRRTLDAIKRLILRESLKQPLVLIFEDLHWIDDESQALLDLLADSIGTARILMMLNYRPEYRHNWSSKTYYAQLRLDPLGNQNADEMLTALLGDQLELRPLKDMIVGRTEGNPFFMEEMVQVMFDEGVLARNGSVKLTRPLESVQVPPTVRGILAARIDRLNAPSKELLRTLAVIGKEFPLGLIRRVTGLTDDALMPLVSVLQLGEFIYEQPAFPETEYTFKHALTQEVSYDSMLIERRRAIHERAAEVLEETHSASLDDHLDQLAYHYSRSNNVAKAVHYLKLAGVQAGRRSAYEDAIRSLGEAIKLLPKLPESRERDLLELELRLAHGPLYTVVRGFAAPQLDEHVARMEHLCASVGESPAIFGVLFAMWSLNLTRGQLHEALTRAERMVSLATPLDQRVWSELTGSTPAPPKHSTELALGGAHAAMGATSVWMGKFRTAHDHLKETIEIFDRDIELYLPMQNASVIPARCQMSWALWMLGHPDQARDVSARSLELADQFKRPNSTAFALLYSIALADFLRDYTGVRPRIDALMEISNEHGFLSWVDSATLSLGRALVFENEPDRGIQMMHDALAGLREHGAELTRSYSFNLVADACLQIGRIDLGIEMIEQGFASFESLGARMQEAEAYRLKGELLLRKGDEVEASNCFHSAIDVARAQEGKSWELRATTSLARLLTAQNRRDEARAMLAAIYSWFTEGFATPDLLDAKSLLDQLAN